MSGTTPIPVRFHGRQRRQIAQAAKKTGLSTQEVIRSAVQAGLPVVEKLPEILREQGVDLAHGHKPTAAELRRAGAYVAPAVKGRAEAE